MPPNIRITLCGLLVIIMLAPLGVNAEATKAKCTCDLGPKNDRQRGAEVTNAAACFLTTDTGRSWCAFDVESLLSSRQHRELVRGLTARNNAGNPNTTLNLLTLRFKHWANSRGGSAAIKRFDGNLNDVLKKIDSGLSANGRTIQLCLRSFSSRQPEQSSEMIGGDELQCGVHPNGWLTLALDFDHFVVYFLVGP